MRLKPVPDGVPEVERLAKTAFQRIGGHHRGLDGSRALHQGGQRINVVQCGLSQRFPVRGILHQSVLEHLSQAVQQFALADAFEERHMHVNPEGIVEYAHHVLQPTEVDACLATDGRIHHAHERGGHVRAADPALVGTGHEAAHIGDHTTAEANEHRITIGLALGEVVPQLAAHLNALGRFAMRNANGLRLAQHRNAAQQFGQTMP